MSFAYNPQVTPRADEFISRGFGALAAGVQDFISRQREEQQKAELLAQQNQKNDLIVNHAFENKLIDPATFNEYQEASGKKRQAIAEGIAANIASDQILAQRKLKEAATNAQVAGTNMATWVNGLRGIAQQKLNDRGDFVPELKTVTDENGNEAHLASVAPDRWQLLPKGGTPFNITPEQMADYEKKGVLLVQTSKGNYTAFKSSPKSTGNVPPLMTSPGGDFYFNGKTWQQKRSGNDLATMMKPVPGTTPPDARSWWQTIAPSLVGGQPAPTPIPFPTPTGAPIAPVTGGVTIQAPVAPAPGTRVRVTDKDGKTFTVPAEQLQQAIDAGYTPAP